MEQEGKLEFVEKILRTFIYEFDERCEIKHGSLKGDNYSINVYPKDQNELVFFPVKDITALIDTLYGVNCFLDRGHTTGNKSEIYIHIYIC